MPTATLVGLLSPEGDLDLHHRRALVDVHARAGELERAEDEVFALVQLGDPEAVALVGELLALSRRAGDGWPTRQPH